MTRQGRTAFMLVGVVVTMASLSFAAVPFYNWFCRVTGFGGTPSVATAAPEVVSDRVVTVRFDASRDAGLPWSFRPVQREMQVRYGETGIAYYEARNLSDRPVAGTAVYNVTPGAAGGYFSKIACFCFTQQVLQPGEVVRMPVTFFVDPAMLDDPEGRYVHTITLSYTFYETDLPEEQAALQP